MAKLLKILFWMFIVGVGGPVLWVILTIVLSSFTEFGSSTHTAETRASVDGNPSSYDPPAELVDALSFMSDLTDIQKDSIKDSHRGKLVQWTLPVWDVSRRDEGYVIQTSSSAKAAVFCNVKSASPEELDYVKRLKEGDMITCKGIVDGYTLGNVNLSPAEVVR